MLSLISIRNYATIDEVQVEFRPGFNVLTGETGAGKSILIDALGLAFGDRAESGTVRHGTDRADISVLFDCPDGHPALQWLLEHDLDDDDVCALRRVVHAEGRSRAYINNQPVKLQDLRTLGTMLIDLHGQHEHHALLAAKEQRTLLDVYGGSSDLAAATQEAWKSLQKAQAELAALAESIDERQSQLEMLRFQTSELDALGLSEGETESLIEEHHQLANVDEIASTTQTALDYLADADTASASKLLSRAIQQLSLLENIKGVAEALSQLRSAELEVSDVASNLRHSLNNLEPDPNKLALLDTRLATIRSLAKRHRVDDAALWLHANELHQELESLETGDFSEDALRTRATECEQEFEQLAKKLSAHRRKFARKLGKTVTSQIQELGLPNGEFTVALDAREKPDGTGKDDIVFNVRLNPGLPVGPLSRVASGGELSRISLALQVAVGGNSGAPSFIFDEVDAGIGGGTAEIVGNKLRELAAKHQILCITHQAQVASKSDVHFRISKLSDDKTSRTRVSELDNRQRIEEIARMIGGIEITAATRAHAKELIDKGVDSSQIANR